ncbi:CLUMA_CG004962, isoform A [Clunio marinus]|uniref:CLUMA_CG004962, isoform A n=1 Tax=Clunio marinus TaxID=568069 RepID=A0A1J1HVA8_9DIPT|nr:CLUMA_CG004962, isoform A [Clunio marinus]
MGLTIAFPTTHEDEEMDGEKSRKIIGQSVVTSVSVIMNGDGEAPHFTDAVGKTVPRPFVPPQVASPINLLNPDRYEFYTFNDSGELVKRLMTLKEIQSIVANGNGAVIGDNEPEAQSVLLNAIPMTNQGAETNVQDIVDNVQSVLSQEIENNKNISTIPSQLLDTPDVSSSWSMILPAIFGNTGDEILPHKPINMTPETDILDTTTTNLPPLTKTTTVKVTTKTTKAPTKVTVPLTKVPATTAKTTTKIKQTVKAKPKPTTTVRLSSTTPKPIETKTSTMKPKVVTTTKKIIRKPTTIPSRGNPTAASRPHLTNSPIIIEYIDRRPSHGSKPEVIKIEYKTQRVTQAPILLNDQLFIDEEDPIVKNLPSTTSTTTEIPIVENESNEPLYEKLELTTMKTKEEMSGNSEIMTTIEKFIQHQTDGKTKKPIEKLDVLGFDDDDETEIKLNETLESKKTVTQSEYVTKAATVASVLSTKYAERQTTPPPTDDDEENDTTVPTILSEALSDVIKLMMNEKEEKKTSTTSTTTSKPSTTTQKDVATEPSEQDLNKLLHHYEDLQRDQFDQLEALSMLSENVETTTQKINEDKIITTISVPSSTALPEMTVVKETSSVSIKKDETTQENNSEMITTKDESEKVVTTTNPPDSTFTTFFSVVDDDETTTEMDLGKFTTVQSVVSVTEKRVSDRKDETYTTNSPYESEEEPIDIMSDVLNAIGIASDLEDDPSNERLKNVYGGESQESDEVESVISSLSSTLDKTIVADVDTDFTLTSKLASSLISVADTISETLTGGDEESEEITKVIPTTFSTVSKNNAATKNVLTTEKVTEKSEEIMTTTINPMTVKELEEATIEPERILEVEIPTTDSIELTTIEEETTEKIQEKEQQVVIRKDSSLEEIDYITPPTHTSMKLPLSEGNFIKIDNIESTKLSGFKNKGQDINEHIKPIYVAVRSTTTEKSANSLPAAPSLSDEDVEMSDEMITERVPLIEATKVPDSVHLSSSEDNLVEIKVHTKSPPITTVVSTTEDRPLTTSELSWNIQAIKENIKNSQQQPRPQSPVVDLTASSKEALGLAATTANLNSDLSGFSKLCNELAFTFWKSITADGISQARSVIISPFALTSMLSMIFLGARGQTSGEMNDLLRLDDMVTFNPHVVFRNISESIEQSRKSGISAASFVRELYSDRSKGKLLPYFKEKAQQFYAANVEEVNFEVVNDIIRRRTNLLVKRHTYNKINEYLKTNNIWVNEPLAAVSANVFLTDCTGATTNDRDGEMFFQVSPAIRQRRLVPIPAAVYRSGFTAGYDPILDATAVAFGDELQSTVMVMPGQQGSSIPGDNLERLESAFMDSSNNVWGRLLTTFMERPGLEVQIPRFSHRSLINATFALQQMGLKDIFDANKADLRGLTGAKSNDLFFSDMLQINQFSTCGEDKIGDSHHIEIYPSPALKRDVNVNDDVDDVEEEDEKLEVASTDNTQLFYDPIYDSRYINVPLPLRPRQARLPENPRLRFDRPFLYFVRHNPTGIILFMGRFNPRLLP